MDLDLNKYDMIYQNRNKEEESKIEKDFYKIADSLLSTYGPEGAYRISEILIELADEDVSDAMSLDIENF